jgi:hypothetical protein
MAAVDQVGFASDTRFRTAIASAIEFGTGARSATRTRPATTNFTPSGRYRIGTGRTVSGASLAGASRRAGRALREAVISPGD